MKVTKLDVLRASYKVTNVLEFLAESYVTASAVCQPKLQSYLSTTALY